MAPKPCTPVYFGAFLARSWAEGTTTKSATCSPTFAILAKTHWPHAAIWRASSLPWRITSPDGSQRLSPDQEAPAASVVFEARESDDRSSDFAAEQQQPSA